MAISRKDSFLWGKGRSPLPSSPLPSGVFSQFILRLHGAELSVKTPESDVLLSSRFLTWLSSTKVVFFLVLDVAPGPVPP